MKGLVLIHNARADHFDLGHQFFFSSNYSPAQRTRSPSDLNYQVPHAKQNYLKHSFFYAGLSILGTIKSADTPVIFKGRVLDSYDGKTLSYNPPSVLGVQVNELILN